VRDLNHPKAPKREDIGGASLIAPLPKKREDIGGAPSTPPPPFGRGRI